MGMFRRAYNNLQRFEPQSTNQGVGGSNPSGRASFKISSR